MTVTPGPLAPENVTRGAAFGRAAVGAVLSGRRRDRRRRRRRWTARWSSSPRGARRCRTSERQATECGTGCENEGGGHAGEIHGFPTLPAPRRRVIGDAGFGPSPAATAGHGRCPCRCTSARSCARPVWPRTGRCRRGGRPRISAGPHRRGSRRGSTMRRRRWRSPDRVGRFVHRRTHRLGQLARFRRRDQDGELLTAASAGQNPAGPDGQSVWRLRRAIVTVRWPWVLRPAYEIVEVDEYEIEGWRVATRATG